MSVFRHPSPPGHLGRNLGHLSMKLSHYAEPLRRWQYPHAENGVQTWLLKWWGPGGDRVRRSEDTPPPHKGPPANS